MREEGDATERSDNGSVGATRSGGGKTELLHKLVGEHLCSLEVGTLRRQGAKRQQRERERRGKRGREQVQNCVCVVGREVLSEREEGEGGRNLTMVSSSAGDRASSTNTARS